MISTEQILKTFHYTSSLEVFGISLLSYLAFISTFFLVLLTKSIFRKIIKKKINVFFLKKDKKFLSTFDKLINFLIFSLAFFISTIFLKDSVLMKSFIDKINASLFTIIIFWTIVSQFNLYFFKIKNNENVVTKDLLEWLISALKIIFFILGFSAVLEIWGVELADHSWLGTVWYCCCIRCPRFIKNLISGVLVLIEKRFKKVM